MFMILKRKNIVVFVLITAVIVTLILCNNYCDKTNTNKSENFSYGIGEVVAVNSDVQTENNQIYQLKQNRKKARYDTLSNLNEIVNNAAIEDDLRKEAAQKITTISNDINTENICEELITAKGFTEVIVYITEKSINVTVKDDELTSDDIVKIKDIIFEQTNNNNIKIVAVG